MSETVTLVATGDLAPLRPLEGSSRAVEEVWDHLRSADLAMTNLELPLTTAGTPAEKAITLRADPGIAASLARAGIDLVTVANNHALDYGTQGLTDTLRALRGVGIGAVGGGDDLAHALKPAVVFVRSTRVAVMGVASTLPPGFAAAPGRPGIAPVRVRSSFLIDSATLDEQPGMSPWVQTHLVERDLLRLCEEVSRVRPEVDLLVVQIHWGIPNGWCAAFQGPLADYQRPLAHALIDAGADLVVGHHPHVVHGVERYADGVVVYSLGNFLFHSMAADESLGLEEGYPSYDLASLSTGEALQSTILEVRLEDGHISALNFLPVQLNKDGEPEFLRGMEARVVLERLQTRSSDLTTEIVLDGDGGASLRT